MAQEKDAEEFRHCPSGRGQENILIADGILFSGRTFHVLVSRFLLSTIPDLFLALSYLIAPFSKVDFTDLHGPFVKFLGRFAIPQSLAGITQNQKSNGDIGMILAQRPFLHRQGLETILKARRIQIRASHKKLILPTFPTKPYDPYLSKTFQIENKKWLRSLLP
jgi:hypothetical protein